MNGKFSSATRADYAEAAVAAFAGEGQDSKTYELAGDDAYTLSDFAAEIARLPPRRSPPRRPRRSCCAGHRASRAPAG
jgi:NAD(P)H dehydrogenase (quinone)